MAKSTPSKEKIKEEKKSYTRFKGAWHSVLESPDFSKRFPSEIFQNYVVSKRWYGGKVSTIKNIEILDQIHLSSDQHNYYGLLIEINFEESFFQNYFITIGFMLEHEFKEPEALIGAAEFDEGKGYLVDAVYIEDFRKTWFEFVVGNRLNQHKSLLFHSDQSVQKEAYKNSKFIGAEQSNTSIIYNDQYVMKFFRRIFIGMNPDYQVSRFLSKQQGFLGIPAYRGGVNMTHFKKHITLGLMQNLVANNGDAWAYFNNLLKQAYLNLERKKVDISRLPSMPLFQHISLQQIPHEFIDFVGLEFFLKVRLLAERTADLHIALGSNREETNFTSTTFNEDYSVWLKNRLIYQVQNRINAIENNLNKLEGEAKDLAEEFLAKKKAIRNFFLDFDWNDLKGERIRIHGDYHLGQILVTDGDFVIIDFEGEPESTIRDRKIKQPPLKDMAGLFRSYHYALFASILDNQDKLNYKTEHLFEAGEKLFTYIVGLSLQAYFEKIYAYGKLNLGYRSEQEFILMYHLTEKAVYELGYELNSRPNWAIIPLKGIASIMKHL
jgi:maltose alpha-D-glucosyltransferase/alpha-amylase